MKKSNRLFQEAERLALPPDLWKRIEARSELARGGRTEAAGFWGAPALRAVAAVVLAVGVLGLGVLMQKRAGNDDAYAVSASASSSVAQNGAQAKAGREADFVDAELLGWHADLGENLGYTDDGLTEAMDAEDVGVAVEAEEML